MNDLTEQWKKGELPSGWYWCKCYNEEIKKLYYDGDCFELDDPETKNYYFFLPKDIEEITILEQEPTFEEWKASENYIDYLKQCISVYESKDKQATETSIAYNELLEENDKIKERNDSLNNRDINLCRIANGIRDENFALKELLKEAYPVIEFGDGAMMSKWEENWLTKAKEILGEDK